MTAYVLVRLQRYDVFPHAFCFNFVGATNSRALSPSFLCFSLVSSLMGAPRNVPRWFSALWMLLAIYPPTSSPLPSSSSHYPSFLSLLHFLLTPSHPSFPPSCYIPSPCTLLLPPLRVGKGLNRPVQSTTSSTSNLRVSRVLCYVIFSRVARVLPRGKTILFRSFV